MDDNANTVVIDITKGLAGDDAVEYRVDIPIQKNDAEHIAFGWGNVFVTKDGVALTDSHGDTIDTDEAIAAIEQAFYDYVLFSRSADEAHQNFNVASLIEGMIFTREKLEKMGIEEGAVPLGIWVAYKVFDDRVWDRIEKGELQMLSIVGEGRRVKL